MPSELRDDNVFSEMSAKSGCQLGGSAATAAVRDFRFGCLQSDSSVGSCGYTMTVVVIP